jgi:AcrR family transcriptional regulator
LEEEGANAVSMRRVASAVGITPMAIYHHFPNREALLKFVVDREFAKLAGCIEARLAKCSAEKGIYQVAEGYLDYVFAQPRIFEYLLVEKRDDARRFPEDFRARKSPSLNLFADTVGAAIQRGDLQKGDAWEIAMQMWAMLQGYVSLYLAGRFNYTEQAFRLLCRRALRRLIDGLRY